MFVRSKSSVRNGASYEYLQIVRSYREGGKVRQQVIASLGRRDRLIASGELDGLLRSLAKFSDNLRVVEAVRTSGLAARTARQWGPALVFGRLWDRQGLPDLLRKLAQDRKFEFDLERAAFAMALQRLCAPGSDLAGSEWVRTVAAPGFEGLALQHFYRTAGFLAGVRQDLETKLFRRDLNLFNQTLDVVFIDTTSLYCYRDTETQWRKRGYSRDHRPDGHIVASFLALRLEVDLQQRLEERENKVSWPDLMRDLGQVQSVLVELDGQRYQLRTDMVGAAHKAFAAAGVRPPPPVTLLGLIS